MQEFVNVFSFTKYVSLFSSWFIYFSVTFPHFSFVILRLVSNRTFSVIFSFNIPPVNRTQPRKSCHIEGNLFREKNRSDG